MDDVFKFGSRWISATPAIVTTAGSAATPVTSATTNVVLLPLSHLQKESQLGSAPVTCEQCAAMLNPFSALTEGKWTCEFCSHSQSLAADVSLPTHRTQDFIVQKAPEGVESKNESGSVLFLIDISGSMGQTTEVTGFEPLGGEKPKKKDEPQFVSRLQFVQKAVVAQLDRLYKNHPETKVGLITFGSNVTIYGDCQAKPTVVSGTETLNDYDQLIETGGEMAMEKPISQTRDLLVQTVSKLTETGMTALGPALAFAVGMVGKEPSSKCIICTDGVANVGVGTLGNKQAGGFYQQIAQFAKRKGVVISVISIKGADTRLEDIGTVADVTRGQVDLVDPNSISFGTSVSKRILASNCTLKLFLPPDLRLRNMSPLDEPFKRKQGGEAAAEKKEGAKQAEAKESAQVTPVTRDVGNVGDDSQVCYEFGVWGPASESKHSEAPVGPGEDGVVGKWCVPIQAQFEFRSLDGAVVRRVATTWIEVKTDDREVRATMDIRVVSANLAQQCAQMARSGNYEAALAYAGNIRTMISQIVTTQEHRSLFATFDQEFVAIRTALSAAMDKEKSAKGGPSAPVSAASRRVARDDQTAQKLYSYNQSNSAACSLM